MIATTAKTDIAFAGINYTVANGIVTLSGTSPTEKSRSEVEQTAKSTAGVSEVINHIVVAPVLLTADYPLKQSVDSVLMKYPAVQANIKDSAVYIEGKVERNQTADLVSALKSLKAKQIVNQLSIQ